MTKEIENLDPAETGIDDEFMEDLMITWQEVEPPADLSALREVFSNEQWRRRLKDLVGIALMTIGVIASIIILAEAALLSEVVMAVFILLIASLLGWKRYHRMWQERSAIPLSPGQYLEASRHNLNLLERENRFLQWVSPVVLPGILITSAWAMYDAYLMGELFIYTPGGLTVLAILMVVLLTRGAWNIYIRKPRKLRAERRALEALEADLRQE